MKPGYQFVEWIDWTSPTGAEIGVKRARTSVTLLESIPDLHLTLIDSWAHHDDYLQIATDRVQFAADRTKIVRGDALEVAYSGTSFDFVIVDLGRASIFDVCRVWWELTGRWIGGRHYPSWEDGVHHGRTVVGHDVRRLSEQVGRPIQVKGNCWRISK